MVINIKRIGNHKMPIPKRPTYADPEFELRAHLRTPACIQKNGFKAIGCGFEFKLINGIIVLMEPHLDWESHPKLQVLNNVVTCKESGELFVTLINKGDLPLIIKPGAVIARVLFMTPAYPIFKEV